MAAGLPLRYSVVMETPVLEGSLVRLEPLTAAHLPALEPVAFDQTNWRFLISVLRTPKDLERWFEDAIAQRDAGVAMPWVTIAKSQHGEAERVVGATRFMDLNRAHRTVEIGNTWLYEPARGTRINTEAKLLQLRYAFEDLRLVRVAFKTHIKNLRSQAAIRGIGASYEGTFRNHMIMPDGSHRDSAWFSILDSEWPEVKESLERRLRAPV